MPETKTLKVIQFTTEDLQPFAANETRNSGSLEKDEPKMIGLSAWAFKSVGMSFGSGTQSEVSAEERLRKQWLLSSKIEGDDSDATKSVHSIDSGKELDSDTEYPHLESSEMNASSPAPESATSAEDFEDVKGTSKVEQLASIIKEQEEQATKMLRILENITVIDDLAWYQRITSMLVSQATAVTSLLGGNDAMSLHLESESCQTAFVRETRLDRRALNEVKFEKHKNFQAVTRKNQRLAKYYKYKEQQHADTMKAIKQQHGQELNDKKKELDITREKLEKQKKKNRELKKREQVQRLVNNTQINDIQNQCALELNKTKQLMSKVAEHEKTLENTASRHSTELSKLNENKEAEKKVIWTLAASKDAHIQNMDEEIEALKKQFRQDLGLFQAQHADDEALIRDLEAEVAECREQAKLAVNMVVDFAKKVEGSSEEALHQMKRLKAKLKENTLAYEERVFDNTNQIHEVEFPRLGAEAIAEAREMVKQIYEDIDAERIIDEAGPQSMEQILIKIAMAYKEKWENSMKQRAEAQERFSEIEHAAAAVLKRAERQGATVSESAEAATQVSSGVAYDEYFRLFRERNMLEAESLRAQKEASHLRNYNVELRHKHEVRLRKEADRIEELQKICDLERSHKVDLMDKINTANESITDLLHGIDVLKSQKEYVEKAHHTAVASIVEYKEFCQNMEKKVQDLGRDLELRR